MLSSGLFPGVCSLNVVSEHSVCSNFIIEWVPVLSTCSHPNYSTRSSQAIFKAETFHFLNRSHTSYLLAYEDGTGSVPKLWL
jgi:hypothetical protein